MPVEIVQSHNNCSLESDLEIISREGQIFESQDNGQNDTQQLGADVADDTVINEEEEITTSMNADDKNCKSLINSTISQDLAECDFGMQSGPETEPVVTSTEDGKITHNHDRPSVNNTWRNFRHCAESADVISNSIFHLGMFVYAILALKLAWNIAQALQTLNIHYWLLGILVPVAFLAAYWVSDLFSPYLYGQLC
ncbi:hypothetical protein EV360DRAFT_87678 [Lentinula raphanica]|nr:hypothetical protein EV360DRAFT_87678 [Lentinula raphanica]